MGIATPTSVVPEVPAGLEIELQDVPFCDAKEAIRRGAPLVSQKVGLIKAIGHGVYRPQDPKTFSIGIMASDTARYCEIANPGKAGGGGESLELALAATIGETVERYSMLFYDKSKMVFGSYRELADYAIAPDQLRLHSREQVEHWKAKRPRWSYFDEDSKIYWAWGWSLTRQAPCLVPATLVYLEWNYEAREAVTGLNASTGLAAGLSREGAILSGLYEVVERDAFAIGWLHEKVRRRIEIDDPELSKIVNEGFHAARSDVRLDFFDVTLDVPIPSLFAIMQRRSEFGPALCVASVSRLHPADAVRKCLREIGQGMPYLRYLLDQLGDWQPKDDHSDLISFDHHFVLYVKRPELAAEALAFCDGIEERVALSQMPDRSTGTLKGDIEQCIELLRQEGREVIVSEITTPDMQEIGFRVVRVIVPGLVPLHGDHRLPFLGAQRLHDIPFKLGWRDEGDPDPGLNRRPHPFP